MRKERTDRNPSPQNNRRGCLCKDGKTYSRKCCDGSFQAQGIGSLISEGLSTVVNQDTTANTSSESTALPSQSSSTVTSLDTTSIITTTTNDAYYDTSQGSSTIVNIDTTNTNTTVSGDEEPTPDPATIESIAITTGTYTIGDTLPLIATFTDVVTVNTTGGTPSIDADLNTNTRTFTYSSGSGTNQLAFNYTLVNGDEDITSVTTSNNIDLNGGTIIDSNNLSITSTISTPTLSLDSINLPTSSNGSYTNIEEYSNGISQNLFHMYGYQSTSSISSRIYYSDLYVDQSYQLFDIRSIEESTDYVGNIIYSGQEKRIYAKSTPIQIGTEILDSSARSLDDPNFDTAYDGMDWTIPKYWAIYPFSTYNEGRYNNGTNNVLYMKQIIKVQENINGKLIVTAIYNNEDAEGDQWVIS